MPWPEHFYVIGQEYHAWPHEVADLTPSEIDGIVAQNLLSQHRDKKREERRKAQQAIREEQREAQSRRTVRGDWSG